MRFAHDCHDSYLAEHCVRPIPESWPEPGGATHPRRSPYRPRLQLGQQGLLVLVRNGTNNVHQTRYAPVIEFFAPFVPNFVQRHCLARFVSLDQIGGDCRRDSDQLLRLGRCDRGIDSGRHEAVEAKRVNDPKCFTDGKEDDGVFIQSAFTYDGFRLLEPLERKYNSKQVRFIYLHSIYTSSLHDKIRED